MHPGTIHYRIQYRPWARFALGLSGGIGLIGIILLLGFDVRGYIAITSRPLFPAYRSNRTWVSPGAFLGFVWAWLLISMRKRPLRELIAR